MTGVLLTITICHHLVNGQPEFIQPLRKNTVPRGPDVPSDTAIFTYLLPVDDVAAVFITHFDFTSDKMHTLNLRHSHGPK